MKAQILKRLVSLGETLEVGDIVDVSSWRHIKSLENSRYIKIIHEEEKPAKAKAEPVEAAKPKKTTKKETVEE
jgi:hypothetical protein